MSARGLLHNGDYLKLLTGQTVSSLGSAMSSFVFTLLGLAITGSPLLVFGALLGVGAVLLTASKPIRTIPLLSDVEAA